MNLDNPRARKNTMIASLLLGLALSGGQTLFDFGPDDRSRWSTVHDTVMGGVSRGELRRTDAQTLVFEGYVSLDNNGGFTSFRSQQRNLPFAGSDGIEARVKGDGRTYILSFDREGVGLFGGGYWKRFDTTPGEWITVRAGWDEFVPVNFGRKIQDLPELTADTALGLTIYLYDKKEGDFSIEFDSFGTYTDSDNDRDGDKNSLASPQTQLPENCQTLQRLIEVSGIGEELAALDGFTLFAPTDDAFQNLPAAQALMQPGQMEALRAVLRRHVVPAKVDSATALFLSEAQMADGATLAVAVSDNQLFIDAAQVLDVDFAFANGIVHTIDRVLLPGPLLPETAIAVPGYKTLSTLLEAADLVDALGELGPFTLFAPTDEAFAALPTAAVTALLRPENKSVLQSVLLGHLVKSRVTAFQAIGANARSLAGTELPIRLENGAQPRLTVAGILISQPDLQAGESVIHQIDAVILPQDLAEQLAPSGPPVIVFLESVVAAGVPQFNDGDIAGCVQRYEQALEALLLLDQLDASLEEVVRASLAKAQSQDARNAAWTLRSSIDLIRAAMSDVA